MVKLVQGAADPLPEDWVGNIADEIPPLTANLKRRQSGFVEIDQDQLGHAKTGQ